MYDLCIQFYHAFFPISYTIESLKIMGVVHIFKGQRMQYKYTIVSFPNAFHDKKKIFFFFLIMDREAVSTWGRKEKQIITFGDLNVVHSLGIHRDFRKFVGKWN